MKTRPFIILKSAFMLLFMLLALSSRGSDTQQQTTYDTLITAEGIVLRTTTLTIEHTVLAEIPFSFSDTAGFIKSFRTGKPFIVTDSTRSELGYLPPRSDSKTYSSSWVYTQGSWRKATLQPITDQVLSIAWSVLMWSFIIGVLLYGLSPLLLTKENLPPELKRKRSSYYLFFLTPAILLSFFLIGLQYQIFLFLMLIIAGFLFIGAAIAFLLDLIGNGVGAIQKDIFTLILPVHSSAIMLFSLFLITAFLVEENVIEGSFDKPPLTPDLIGLLVWMVLCLGTGVVLFIRKTRAPEAIPPASDEESVSHSAENTTSSSQPSII